MVLGILEFRFPPGVRLSASEAAEVIGQDLDELRMQGEDVTKPSQGYLSDWVANGYLERRLLPGDTEESYELSASAAAAVSFASSLVAPRVSATESRLSTVLHQVGRLAEDTDADRESRLRSLRVERDRINEKIRQVEESGVRVIDPRLAVERAREIIALSSDLISDFTRVRADFEALNRDLRHRIVEGSDQRSETLDRLFAGMDLIAESEAGRSFNAFWRMLMDHRQRGLLDDFLEVILSRDFAVGLAEDERLFLYSLSDALLERGGGVHLTHERLARSLRDFVRSNDYAEQRRLGELLRQANTAALSISDRISPRALISLELELSGASIKSIDQWTLKDPALGYEPKSLEAAADFDISLEDVASQVRSAEIDFRSLKEHVSEALKDHAQVSIAELVDRYGADQGLGTILGYLHLGYRIAELVGETEAVSWTGIDGIHREASIPRLYFLKERLHELK
jgi:hypothetical protein